jgi:hypothetical protein
MINLETVKDLLKNSGADSIICREFGLKPTSIAFDIAALSNATFDEGYIVLGATKDQCGYKINGINSRFKVDGVLSIAVNMLSNQPKIDHGMFTVDGKNVCIIYIKKTDSPVVMISSENNEGDKKGNSSQAAIFRTLFLAAMKLQRNYIYKDATEDERNDFIRDIIETSGYTVRDQTRQGASNTGKSTGEIDLLIQNQELPLCIVEALNLDSLKKDYLDTHIDKIYKYDTLGNKFNVILSYVKVVNFGLFWEKYLAHIKEHTYPHLFIGIDESIKCDLDFSDIRYATTQHNRNGKMTYLIHICVRIQT